MSVLLETKFNTVNALAKHLKSRGHFVYKRSKRELSVSVMTAEKNRGPFEFDTVEIIISGDTPQEMFNQYETWIKDKTHWVDKCRVAIFDNLSKIDYMDLEEELYDLGFKYVEIEHEDSNFVEVMVKYCYIDDAGTFKYDGDMFIDDKGDKFETLEYLKQWVEENKYFKPTLTRF